MGRSWRAAMVHCHIGRAPRSHHGRLSRYIPASHVQRRRRQRIERTSSDDSLLELHEHQDGAVLTGVTHILQGRKIHVGLLLPVDAEVGRDLLS